MRAYKPPRRQRVVRPGIQLGLEYFKPGANIVA
jgi:hypothetical protein